MSVESNHRFRSLLMLSAAGLALDEMPAALERIRTDRRMTRKQLARVIKLPEARIEKTERFRNRVTLDTLRAYCAAFPEAQALAKRVLGMDVEFPADIHAALMHPQAAQIVALAVSIAKGEG